MRGKVYFIIVLMGFIFPIILTPRTIILANDRYELNFRDRFFAVHFHDKDGWIVGDEGIILFSQDRGKIWNQISIAWDQSFNDVTFIGNQGWIVGDEGIILHTKDRGRHWKKQESRSRACLMAAFFLDERKGAAIGQQTVLWTEDGGIKWHPSLLDWETILPEALIEKGVISPNLYDLFFVNETHGWMVGDNGMVFFSGDGGRNWKVLRIGMYPPLYSVFFKDEREGFAAGQRGTLLHTEDGGKSWHRLNSPTRMNLFNIKLKENYGVAAGDLGTILQSIDGGKTWKCFPLELRLPSPWFLDTSFLASNSAWKVICVGEGIIREISFPLASVEGRGMVNKARPDTAIKDMNKPNRIQILKSKYQVDYK